MKRQTWKYKGWGLISKRIQRNLKFGETLLVELEEESEFTVSSKMNLLYSAYKVVPPPRNEFWTVQVPAASTSLMFYSLACYAPDKTGMPWGGYMLFIDLMVGHLFSLLTRSPESIQCCSLTYCFYLLTFPSKLSHISQHFRDKIISILLWNRDVLLSFIPWGAP